MSANDLKCTTTNDQSKVTLDMVLNNIKEIQETLKITLKQNDDMKKQNESLKKEFLSFKTNVLSEVKALDRSVKDIKHSQDFIQEEYDKQRRVNDNLLKANRKIENEHNQLTNQITCLQKQLTYESTMRNNLEQYGRRQMVEINGIPSTENEDCVKTVSKLAKMIAVPNFTPNKIDVAHRISPLKDSPIIVKFNTRTDRNNFFESRKNLKGKTIADLGFRTPNTSPVKGNKIFVNESLTTSNKTLFKAVRERCNEKSYDFFWSRNGSIYARKNKDTNAIKITIQDDLKKIN